MCSPCTDEPHVAIKNVLPWKCKKWVPLALLSSYKIFHTAVNNIKVLRSQNCPIFFLHFKQIRFSQHIFIKVSNIKFDANPSSGSQLDKCRWMHMIKLLGTFQDYVKATKKGAHPFGID